MKALSNQFIFSTACMTLAMGLPCVPTVAKQTMNIKAERVCPILTADLAPSPIDRTTVNNEVVAVIPGRDKRTIADIQQADAFAKAGKVAFAGGFLASAEIDFQRAVDLNWNNTDALEGLAQTLEQEGKSLKAIDVYRYYLYPKKGWGTSQEQNPILRMHFALLLVSTNQWPEAVSASKSFMDGLSYGTNYPPLNAHFEADNPQPELFKAMAHLVMAFYYRGHADPVKSIPDYEAAVKAQPNLAVVVYYYGIGLRDVGRWKDAKAALQYAATLDDAVVTKAANKELKFLP